MFGLVAVHRLLAQAPCGIAALQLTPDYSFAIGSSTAGGAYKFTLGSQTLAQGAVPQLALFHYDNSLASTSGVAPAQSSGTSYVPGKFGFAVSFATNGVLSYPQAGNVSLADGTVEMWVALQRDGSDSVYAQGFHALFQAGQIQMAIAKDSVGSPYIFAGVSNVYTGYATATYINGWKAGQWHHLAFSYSSSQGRLRFYVDGTLSQENDSAINLPAGGPSTFTIGGAYFNVDEVRISNSELPGSTIGFDGARSTPFANNEVVLPLTGVSPGQLTYSAAGCPTAPYNWTGIPISNLSPTSNLLAPGTTSVNVSFQTVQPTACGYAVGTPKDYPSMQPLSGGQGTSSHQGLVSGLSGDPQVLNQVYIRCGSNPDYVQTVMYRSTALANPPFPRISNVWWGRSIYGSNLAAKTNLFIGPGFNVSQANTVRAANPSMLALPSFGATYPSFAPPSSYLMKDTHGNPILEWGTGTYMLNMTLPEAAEWNANNIFQQLVQSQLAFDGIFLDSLSTSISWFQRDARGNPVQISSKDNGIADDPVTLDREWKAGVLHEIDTFRRLAPYAYISCHCDFDADLVRRFNGTSIGLTPTDAREGRISFASFFDGYNAWSAGAQAPTIVGVEGTPPNQLAYGYGQQTHNIPAEVLQFGYDFYPNMRFGLTATLMNDGYYFHGFGEDDIGTLPYAYHWYDEYDFSLGYPLGAAAPVNAVGSSVSLLINGGFENGLAGWRMNESGGVAAAASIDSAIMADGNSSAKLAILSNSGTAYHIGLDQANIAFTSGITYRLQFWARSDIPRTIRTRFQGSASNISVGPGGLISTSTSWAPYSYTFAATASDSAGHVQLWLDDLAGNVWIDDVQLSVVPPAIYRRDFDKGVVLLNATTDAQTIPLEPGLQRFTGTQAPKYQYIVDDSSPSFRSTGAWNVATYDIGVRWDDASPTSGAQANGPFYHAWQGTVHQLDTASGTAQWDLGIAEDGQYTIQAWLPAAANAATWTKNATYEIVSGGNVLASAVIDQTGAASGDGWRMVSKVNLTAAGMPFLRLHNGGPGSLIADAVYVTSDALYNDGSPVPQVTLAAMDGILLQRQTGVAAPASHVNSAVNAASFQPTIASGAFVSIAGTGFGSSSRSWTSSDFPNSSLPISLDGISVTINGKAAYVAYTSPTQIIAIAPDDDTIGQVPVQVTTPQGASYTGNVLKQKSSPGLFTYQSGTTSYAAAVHRDGTLVAPAGSFSRPAVAGEVIEVFGTGFGATSPVASTSQLISQPAATAFPVTMTIGGAAAEVQWAGLVSPGLYQLSVKIPDLATGDQPVQTSISGFQSPAAPMLSISNK